MKEAIDFFSNLQRETLLSVATAAPAKLIRYNRDTKRADIQPLFLTADKDDNLFKQSIIEDCPVMRHCQSDCASGLYPLVFYQVVQRNLDNLNGTNLIDPDSYDIMSSNDAIVIGVFDG